MNCLRISLPETSSFLKCLFTDCRILDWQFFFYFSTVKLSFYRLPASFILAGTQPSISFVLFFFFFLVKIIHYFPLVTFKVCPFPLVFPGFLCDVSRCGFLGIYPARGLQSFRHLQVHACHQFQKVLHHCSSFWGRTCPQDRCFSECLCFSCLPWLSASLWTAVNSLFTQFFNPESCSV